MKSTIALTVLFSFMLLTGYGTAFAQTNAKPTGFTTDDPAEYSNYIVDLQEAIGKEFIEFSMVLINSSDFKTSDQKRLDVLRTIELSLRKLRNMAPFKGTTGLRDESVAVFEFYKKLHTEEYARLGVLISNKESSNATLEEYFQLQVKVEKQMRKYAQRLKEAQKQFAKEQRLTLLHSEMQDQFDRLMEANIYSREVFLGYLSVAKVNEAWWDAMQVDDFEGMEKQRLALLEAARSSSIQSMEGLHGYTDFRDVAKERVDWFGSLAENEYKKIHDILNNERRTGEDIDYINEVVEIYNTRNAELNTRYNETARQLKTRALPSQQGETK